jgi:hypothetical protein
MSWANEPPYYFLSLSQILAFAVRLDSDQFRDQLRRVEVSQVLQRAKKPLLRVFKAYAGLNPRTNKPRGVSCFVLSHPVLPFLNGLLHAACAVEAADENDEESGSIDCPEFMTLLRDAKLLDQRLNATQVRRSPFCLPVACGLC